MEHLSLSSSQPFPFKIFNPECFVPKPISSPKSKTTTMSYSQCPPVTIKREQNKEEYATSSPPKPHPSQPHFSQRKSSFGAEPKLGQPDSPNLPLPTSTYTPPKTTSWKLHRDRDIPVKDITLQSLVCKVSIDKSESNKPLAIDIVPKPSVTALHHDAQLYFSQVNNNQYVHKNSHLLLSGSFSSTQRSRTPPRESPPRIHDPLPNIWSKVSSLPPKQDRHHSPDHFRPHAELLLHLRKSPALPPTPISPLSQSTPQTPLTQSTRSQPSLPQPQPQTLRSPPPPPPPPHAPLTSIPHHRPRRANDYTGEFKREFCALLSKHADARAQWEHFWRRRECTGRRPCIKSYLAFCDLFAEFTKLRRAHKYRVLGTRTNCECSYPAHTQPSTTRFTPY